MTSLAAVAAAALLLTGCATVEADDGAGAASEPEAATHTMPDGTVMDGSSHAGHTDHDAKERDAGEAGSVGPSTAARMVCSGLVVDDVTRIFGLDAEPTPSSGWTKPMFTCTFELDNGPLVLSVHDAADEATGRDHFETLRASLDETTPLKGVYGLGLPAYETDGGTVAFIKDGKTLEVDATRLSGNLGVEGDMTKTEVAYAVATSVLACWTAHT